MSKKVLDKNKLSLSKNNSNLTGKFLASNIITTPYEKVLSIIKQAKDFISKISKEQIILIQNLEWAIKVITSRSLYSYEIKEKETINKLSKENPEFKQLVDFVSEYNEKVIKMYQKYNYILTDKLLAKPSTKLNRKRIIRKSSFVTKSHHLNLLEDEEDIKETEKKVNKRVISNKNNNFGAFLGFKTKNKTNLINTNINNSNNNTQSIAKSNPRQIYNYNTISNDSSINCRHVKNESNHFCYALKKKLIQKKIKKQIININDETNKKKNNLEINQNLSFNNKINCLSHRLEDSQKKSEKKIKNRYSLFPSVQKISITINNNNDHFINAHMKEISDKNLDKNSKKNLYTSINSANISLTNSIICPDNTKKNKNEILKTNKNTTHSIKDYSFTKIQNRIIHEGIDASKLINVKNFDVFLLKDILGYNNVLPYVGRVILENLGLIDEEILNIEKLDSFLTSVNGQYKEETLYHNGLHGTDVTQSCYIFFSHSNAENIAKTNVLDLLSIFISALGHDIGHPGLTNTFHINESTEMAITYNDISVLENFHASTLFKTIRRTETNIFEKLTNIDYKIIRKRMISEILATDMANHGKVISLIKSKISVSENGKDFKFNLLSGNEQTKNEEQQCLLDFLIHLADLSHNTRLFNISIKWVELLSEEFWLQGDLEKKLNLPVSFLCDREKVNIPQSQKGFISGFVIPAFDCLVSIFPTLRFTLDNANDNLKEWQKLLNDGRLRGWTPPKKKEEEEGNWIKKASTRKFVLSKDGGLLFMKNKENNNINNNSNKINNNNSNKNNYNNNQKKKSKFITSNSTNINFINTSPNDSPIKNVINKKINKIIIINANNSNKKNNNNNKLYENNNIEMIRRSQIQSKKSTRFNTPLKLKIIDDFDFSNNNISKILLSSNIKKDIITTDRNIKKNVINNFVYKKNVNKTKNNHK